uniref:Thioredoxin domain-containing protein n=1 Tax=viral metagenome TaxID=1070528 RepID=A0A6C0DU64_9ZZZZ
MTRLPLLTEIRDRTQFSQLLETNPGKIIIKFGAEWCAPCKLIEKQVFEWIDKMPETIQCIVVDIDESFDVYAFLKTKKMLNGIPAILCYNQGNTSYIPDDAVIGADKNKVNEFFQRCLE